MADDDNGLTLSRRKLLGSAATVGSAAVLGGAGSTAFFSDEEEFANDRLVAGELDLKVSWEEHYSDWLGDEQDVEGVRMVEETGDLEEDEVGLPSYDDPMLAVPEDSVEEFMDATLQEQFPDEATREQLAQLPPGVDPCEALADVPDDLEAPVIDLEDVKPGDFGEVTFDFTLCDNPGYVWLTGGLVEALENGLTEPERKDPDEQEDVVELLDELQVTVWYDSGDNVLEETETYVTDRSVVDGNPLSSAVALTGDQRIVAQGTLRGVLDELATGAGIPLDGIPNDAPRDCFDPTPTIHYLGFSWALPVDHANEIQTDSVAFDLGFYAEQCRHNDGSGIAPEETRFTVRVENVSTPETLQTSQGSVAVPLSPGAFAVHDGPGPIFAVNEAASAGLEDLAEDGDPTVLGGELADVPGLTDSGTFGGSPIGPGGAYEFEVTAREGDSLSLATMFVQSNDLFFAPGPAGMDLFDPEGDPVSGDVTDQIDLWDASTEDDQEPGVGDNQAPRQGAPNTGPADSNSDTVGLVEDVNQEGYSYPVDEDVIEVTITPQ